MKRAEIEANARAPYARRIMELEAEAAILRAALATCARYIELEHSAHQEADDRSALNTARVALEPAGRRWTCPDCGSTKPLAAAWQRKLFTNDPPGYAERVRALEAEGLTTSDAQAVADAEALNGREFAFDPAAPNDAVFWHRGRQ